MQKSFQVLAKLNLVLILDLFYSIQIREEELNFQTSNKHCELEQILNPLVQYGFVEVPEDKEACLRKAQCYQDKDGNIYNKYEFEVDGVKINIVYVVMSGKNLPN